MTDIGEPVLAWSHVLHPALDDATLATLFGVADQVLDLNDQHLIRAYLARDMARAGQSDRALRMVTPLAGADVIGADTYLQWSVLTQVARITGDTELFDSAMVNLARAALVQGGANSMLRTALDWRLSGID